MELYYLIQGLFPSEARNLGYKLEALLKDKLSLQLSILIFLSLLEDVRVQLFMEVMEMYF